MAQTGSLIGHNYYDSVHGPWLLTNAYIQQIGVRTQSICGTNGYSEAPYLGIDGLGAVHSTVRNVSMVTYGMNA